MRQHQLGWSPVRHVLGLRRDTKDVSIPINATVGAGAGFVTTLSVRELMPKVGLPLPAAPLITAVLGGGAAALMKDWKFGAGVFAGTALAYALDIFGILRIPPK